MYHHELCISALVISSREQHVSFHFISLVSDHIFTPLKIKAESTLLSRGVLL